MLSKFKHLGWYWMKYRFFYFFFPCRNYQHFWRTDFKLRFWNSNILTKMSNVTFFDQQKLFFFFFAFTTLEYFILMYLASLCFKHIHSWIDFSYWCLLSVGYSWAFDFPCSMHRLHIASIPYVTWYP